MHAAIIALLTAGHHAPEGGHGEAHHGAEAASGGLPQFAFEHWPGMIFWLLVALAGLYFALSRVVLPQIGGVIEDRRDKIEDDLDEAKRLSRQAEEAERAYNQALADARARAGAIAAETRAKLDAEIAQQTAAAEAEFAERASAAETRIGEATDAALANVRAIAAEAASAAVARLTGDTPALAEAERAIDELNGAGR